LIEEAERFCSCDGIMAYRKLLCIRTPEDFRLAKGYHLVAILDPYFEEDFAHGLRENVLEESSSCA
jgi:hypothetical protein